MDSIINQKGTKISKNKTNIVRQSYNNYIYEQTKKYQKKYGFEIGEGSHDAWNNEADAFKHTFMSADMALKTNAGISKYKGDEHEIEGRNNMGQSSGEENMDRWNNAEGRKIAQKIAKEIKNPFVLKAYALSGRLEDRIAEEVMHKMRKGDLITHPNDKRRYTETPKKDTRTPSQRLDDEIREKYKRMKNQRLQRVFGKSSGSLGNGKWVTINGNHVFIED